MCIRNTVLLSTLTLLWPMTAAAEIYRYEVDGQVIYTSTPMSGESPTSVMHDSSGHVTPVAPSSPGASAAADHNAFDAYIAEASEAYSIPEAFIKAVIHVESAFNPNAVSHAGAMGLMQLMPGTAEYLGCADPFDPRQNIMAGTYYLNILSNQYDGDINLVLSAYNAGSGNVARAGGIPFEQTQRYVQRVFEFYRVYLQEG
jgi:soluble lytic murein transglycosylase-like protein